MKLGFLVFFAAAAIVSAQPSAPPAPGGLPESTKGTQIVMNNQVYVLVGKEESRAVSTYRYVTPGSTSDDWTELVTHQVLKLATRSGADEVLGYLKERNRDELRLEGILETRKAAVFASLAPKSEKAESQLGVGLIFIDLSNSFEVHIISFTLKPNRLSTPDVEAKLRSWRDLFRARATAIASS